MPLMWKLDETVACCYCALLMCFVHYLSVHCRSFSNTCNCDMLYSALKTLQSIARLQTTVPHTADVVNKNICCSCIHGYCYVIVIFIFLYCYMHTVIPVWYREEFST